jgi:hypothetical protein
VALVAIRLPSLNQPMGSDQALYAYVGDRILHGERPYVDAWDQKPPAIHYTYAVMRAIWPGDGVVAAADLAAIAATAALLFFIGRNLATPGVGAAAALLLLFLSNPAFTRLGGVRVRAQAETFIAVAVTAAVCLLARERRGILPFALAGLTLGAAFAFKYNAAVYAVAAALVLWRAGALTVRRAAAFAGGYFVPILLFGVLLWSAWQPLYEATITYNVRYSGETYSGPLHFVRYLLTLAFERARDDALWTLGCAGCAVLLVTAMRKPLRLVPVIWVATACLSIAINGSRGLPQYFVQAAPGLALAAAWAGWVIGAAVLRATSPRAARLTLSAALILVLIGVWRVNQFPKLVEQTIFDAQRAAGHIPDDVYLDRYADQRKYSALAATQLADVMRQHSAADDRVYVFGFTGAAYVYAGRASASRFFWSRPVIAGFNDGVPGYGTAGLLADLTHARPAVVALQQHDWAPDVDDSAHFFLSTPPLAEWLRAHYQPAPGPDGFDVWIRRN